jgi:Fe-S oxidoreductase
VDLSSIMIEYLGQRNALLRPRLRERLFDSLPALLRHRRALRLLVRLRNRLPWIAALAARGLGIAAARSLPEPAPAPFRAPSAANGAVAERAVVLFVDTFAQHFEPSIAQAAHAVLTAVGYTVQVLQPAAGDTEPDRPLCCGRTWLSLGQTDTARAEARRLHQALRPALEGGTPIVGLEPSCILSLRDDHLKLGLGEDATRLAGQVYLFEEFLAREHDRKRFTPAFKPLSGQRTLIHGHCHAKAVGAMKSLRKVLRMVPELDFEFVEASCCGMAGSFGLEAEHAELSMRMAEQDLLPALRAAPEAMVLANGFSCRHQIRDGAGRSARHVAELLQAALP